MSDNFTKMSIPICYFILLYALIFSISWNKLFVYAITEVPNGHYHDAETKLSASTSTCTTGHEQQLKGLRITHQYGPCSPLGKKRSSPDSKQILLQDQIRVHSINSITTNLYYSLDDHGEGTKLPIFGRSLGAGNYLVTVGLGTPKQDLTLMLDTGSEITWVQCEPCSIRCYHQQDSIFYPSKSTSFSNATCTSNSKCNYAVTYNDKSYSNGYFGNDTLTISPADTFPRFLFGCGQNNSDGFGGAAGLLGLGQSSGLSLVSQTAVSYAQIFCYCLPATESSTGYLLFGLQALETCQTNNFTPLISNPKIPSLYFVNLLGFTLGNQKFYSFNGKSSSRSNTIIDSGTVITRLPPSAYEVLRSMFMEAMRKYPVAPKLSNLLNICYNLKGLYNDSIIPTMVLHFDKVDVKLEASAVVWREDGDSQVCLAFSANGDEKEYAILGNHQQRTLNLLFDIQERKVEFGTGSCGS